jgi:beta-mannosidase
MWFIQHFMNGARLTTTTAFDDQTSTFIIPSGAGFEVVFCPGARSTTILSTSRDEMLQLAQQGRVDKQATMMTKKSVSEMARRSAASKTPRLDGTMLAFALVVVAVTSALHVW